MINQNQHPPKFNAYIEKLSKEIYSDFSPNILNLKKCRTFILTALHGPNPCCAYCGTMFTNSSTVETFFTGRQVKCTNCCKRVTGLTKTKLAYLHANFDELYLLLFLTSLGLKKKQIAQIMHRSPSTIRDWFKRFERKKDGGTNEP